VDQLAKQAAELALRLAALPADQLRTDLQALDAIERLASEILKEVTVVRARNARPPGESRGMWRAVQPLQRF
jgi:hypothetical protein